MFMEIRFSDEINEILGLAREEAMRTGSYGIEIDHIFLGILRHGSNAACALLVQLGADLTEAKVFLDSRMLLSESIPYSSMDKIRLSKGSQRVISLAVLESTKLGESQTSPLHLLLAISRDGTSCAHEFLKQKGVDAAVLLTRIMVSQPAGSGGQTQTDGEGLTVEEYGADLCALAAAGALDPVDGRREEIGRVIEILCRRRKNNALLVGEAGVGKSAIVESLALKIAEGGIPALRNKRLISLDIASVVAGTRYRGDFEKRL